jgi:hypothetical protein
MSRSNWQALRSFGSLHCALLPVLPLQPLLLVFRFAVPHWFVNLI